MKEQEENKEACLSCQVPMHLHGTCCGWSNARGIINPQNAQEEIWERLWKRATKGGAVPLSDNDMKLMELLGLDSTPLQPATVEGAAKEKAFKGFVLHTVINAGVDAKEALAIADKIYDYANHAQQSKPIDERHWEPETKQLKKNPRLEELRSRITPEKKAEFDKQWDELYGKPETMGGKTDWKDTVNWVRDPDTLYTYYKVEYKNCHPSYDETICQSLDDVKKALQVVDTDLDDDSDFEPEMKPKVIITGIGMTDRQYEEWVKRCHEDNEYS